MEVFQTAPHPYYGGTRTTTIQTTYTATPDQPSVTVRYPWPVMTSPQSTTVVLTIPIVDKLSVDVTAPVPIITQTMVLPVLVLTVVEAVVVDQKGKAIDHGIMTQPLPATFILGEGPMPTEPIVSKLLVLAASNNCMAFNCWTTGQKIGVLIAIIIGGLSTLCFFVCCTRCFRSRRRLRIQVQRGETPSSEGDIESGGPYYPGIEDSPPRLRAPPPSTASSLSAGRSTFSSGSYGSLTERLTGMLLWKQGGAPLEHDPKPSSLKHAEEDLYNSLLNEPTRNTSRSDKDIDRQDFGHGPKDQPAEAPTTPDSLSAEDLAYRLDSHKYADKVASVLGMEPTSAAQQAHAQYRYNQGHAERHLGENRRRERSTDYERRGDRLRKESPEAKAEEKEEKLSAAAHRERLRARRVGTSVPTLKVRGKKLGVSFAADESRGRRRSQRAGSPWPMSKSTRVMKQSDHAGKNADKNDAEYKLEFGNEGKKEGVAVSRRGRGNSREEEVVFGRKEKGKGRAVDVTPPPAIQRKHSQQPRFAEPDSASDEHRFESDEDSRGRILNKTKQRVASKREQDSSSRQDSKRNKRGSGEFGRYGERKSRNAPSPEKKRRSILSPRKNSPEKEKRRSRVWDLLPLALQAVDVLTEPRGGWEQYHKEDDNKRESIERERSKRIHRRERRHAERTEEPMQPPPARIPTPSQKGINLADLDRTLLDFRKHHSPLAFKASREHLEKKWSAQEQDDRQRNERNDQARLGELMREQREKDRLKIQEQMRIHEDALRESGFMPRGGLSRAGEQSGHARVNENENNNRVTPSSKTVSPADHQDEYYHRRPSPHSPPTLLDSSDHEEHEHNRNVSYHIHAPTPTRSLSRKHVRVVGGGRRYSAVGGDGIQENGEVPDTADDGGLPGIRIDHVDRVEERGTAEETSTEREWGELRSGLA